jgi:hypothetical protein
MLRGGPYERLTTPGKYGISLIDCQPKEGQVAKKTQARRRTDFYLSWFSLNSCHLCGITEIINYTLKQIAISLACQ